jgi:general secretion pathway protein J
VKRISRSGSLGFTLIELLAALIILSLLALMSYRGLLTVLEARDYTKQETEKWRRVTSFFTRFERDVRLAAPRPVRVPSGVAPAWQGRLHATPEGRLLPYLEFSRFAPFAPAEEGEGVDTARRVAYQLNQNQEIELWLWPGLDVAAGMQPVRYSVLAGVAKLELHYLGANRQWVDSWPVAVADSPISTIASLPQALRIRIILSSGEEIQRIFR